MIVKFQKKFVDLLYHYFNALYSVHFHLYFQTHMTNCVKSFRLDKNCEPKMYDNTPLDEKIYKVDKPPLVATRAPAGPQINPKTHQSPSIITKKNAGPQGLSYVVFELAHIVMLLYSHVCCNVRQLLLSLLNLFHGI